MTHSVKHKFQSTIPDSGDSSVVRPSNWNDEHNITIDLNDTANLSNTLPVNKLAASTISGVTLGNNLANLTNGTGITTLSYNGSSTATINVNTASTSQAGIVQLSDSVNSTSSTTAATSAAVKSAYDLANSSFTNPSISGNITVGGELRGPATFIIDPAAIGDDTGTVRIRGNLQVDGATTTINSTTLTVDDKNIILASGAADSAAADGAGITIDGANASFNYVDTGTKWQSNINLGITGNLTITGNATLGDAEATDIHAIKGATTLLANSANAALTVTQTGSGNAFVVEDSASTDSTPFVVNASGNTGVGIASPTNKLHVQDTSHQIKVTDNSTGSFATIGSYDAGAGVRPFSIRISNDGTGGTTDVLAIRSDGTTTLAANTSNAALTVTQTGSGNAFVVEDSASTDSTPFVIDANGRVGIGSVPLYALDGLSITSASSFNPQITLRSTSNDAAGTYIGLEKARGTLIAQSGDVIGELQFRGADGSGNFIISAGVATYVDGTPGTNDMPGRLVFSTTADGASNPTERMRIDSAGRTYIGGTTGAEKLNVTGAILSNGASTNFDQTGAQFDYASSFGRISSYVSTGSGLTFWTNPSGGVCAERMRINSSGTVSVGGTTGQAKFNVEGANDAIMAYSASPRIYLNPSTANTKFRLAAQDSYSNKFEISYSTTAPAGNGTSLTYTPAFTIDGSGISSFSGQIQSSVTTGTSPLSVTSTTVNTNLNADLLDGYHVGTSGSTIPLLNTVNTWTAQQTHTNSKLYFGGGVTICPESTVISAAATGTGAIEIASAGAAGTAGAAYMTFHRPNAYAVHFGLDTDNNFKFGGWSEGAASFKFWTEKNDGSGSGLDADLLDGYHIGTSGSTVPLLNTSNTWSNNQAINATSSGSLLYVTNGGTGAAIQADNVLLFDNNIYVANTNGSLGIKPNGSGVVWIANDSNVGGTTNNAVKIISEIGLSSGNSVYTSKWLRRDSTGTDWTTIRIHDAIHVDSSFGTPGTDTKVWYERDPNDALHEWGNTSVSSMVLSCSTAFNSTLQVYGTVQSTRAATTAAWAVRAKTNGLSNDTGVWVDASNNFQFAARDGSNNLTAVINSAGNSYLTGGNVGIGISSPTAKLHGNYASTINPSLTWDNASAFNLRCENSELIFGLSATNPYPFYLQARTSTSTSRALSLNPLGGNIGINQPNPTSPFHVLTANNYDTANFESSGNEVKISLTNTSTNGRQFSLVNGGAGGSFTGGKFGIYDGTASRICLAIDNTGKVGINTVSPAAMLHIKGTWVNGEGILQIDADSGTQYSGLTLQNNGTVKGYLYHDNTNGYNYFGSADTSPLVFGYNSTSEWMRLNATGLGIGTKTPQAKLDIHGSNGQLFSVVDSMSGSIFSVNDISGIPSIEVLDTGDIKLAEFGGNVGIGVIPSVTRNNARLQIVDGIGFPATQVASTDANTLDDYRENTWTPAITFGGGNTGITYSTQIGTYTKIGRLVHIFMELTLSSKGSSTGAMLITSLPFSAANNEIVSLFVSAVTSGVGDTMLSARVSGSTIILYKMATGTMTQFTDADLTATTNIRISGSYQV